MIQRLHIERTVYLLCSVLFVPAAIEAQTTHRVCPTAGEGCGFTSLQAAITAAAPDDTIVVAAGKYAQCAVIPVSRTGLTIKGEPGAHLSGQVCLQKGVLVIQGDNTTIEGLEISGASVGSSNGAAIRNEAASLTVRGNYLHDNQTAYLGGNEKNSGLLLMEHNRFERNGLASGPSHNVYIAKKSKHAIFRHNVVSHTTGGHDVKCGAARCEIYNNLLGPSDYAMSVAINVQLGGIAHISGNVAEKGVKATNPWFISIADEPQNGIYPADQQDIVIENNIGINSRTGGSAVRFLNVRSGGVVNGVEYPVIPIPVTLRNNVLYGFASLVDPAAVGLVFREDMNNALRERRPPDAMYPATLGEPRLTIKKTDTVMVTPVGAGLAMVTYAPLAQATVYTAPYADYACNGATWFKCQWTAVPQLACGSVQIPYTPNTWVRVDAGGPSPIVKTPPLPPGVASRR